MVTYEFADGKDFFNLLYNNQEFCSELGKVSLAAGQLEAEIISFLTRKGVVQDFEKTTLGMLTPLLKKKDLVNSNVIQALTMFRDQRNYLMHNIYALLAGQIKETILEGKNLLDSDVSLYIYRAAALQKNLSHMAKVIRNSK